RLRVRTGAAARLPRARRQPHRAVGRAQGDTRGFPAHVGAAAPDPRGARVLAARGAGARRAAALRRDRLVPGGPVGPPLLARSRRMVGGTAPRRTLLLRGPADAARVLALGRYAAARSARPRSARPRLRPLEALDAASTAASPAASAAPAQARVGCAVRAAA